MIQQLVQVLQTYWQRRLVLLFAAAMCVPIFVLYGAASNQRQQRAAPPRSIPMPYERFQLSDMHTMLENSDQSLASNIFDPQHASRTRSLEITINTSDPIPDLKAFTKLKSLGINGTIQAADVDNISQLQQLSSLSLLELETLPFPEGVIRKLGSNLTELQTTDRLLLNHPDEVHLLGKLEYLELHGRGVTPELIDLIAQLPELRTLILQIPMAALSAEELSPLRDHPRLRSVYANWEYFPQQAEALAPLQTLPINLPRGYSVALPMSQFVSMLLSILLGMQLGAQFSVPGAQVIPRFAFAHQCIASLIFAVVTATAVFGLARLGLSFTVALAIVLWIPAGIALIALIAWLRRASLNWVGVPLGLLMIGNFSYSSYLMKSRDGHYLWFLTGNMPNLTLWLLAGELMLVFLLLYRLPASTSFVNESFLNLPTQDFDLFQQWSRPNRRSPFLSIFDFSLRRMSYHGHSQWRIIQLWRLGTPVRPLPFILVFLPFMLLFGGVGMLLNGTLAEYDTEQFVSKLLPFGAVQLVGMGLILPSLGWHIRKKYLETEFLRPVDRQSFVRQLFLAFACDHWLGGLGVLVGAGFAFLRPLDGTILSSIAVTAACIAALVWAYAAGTATFAFKQNWQSGMIAGGLMTLLLPAFVVLAIVAEAVGLSDGTGLIILTILSLFTILLGCGLTTWMFRRSLRREWG